MFLCDLCAFVVKSFSWELSGWSVRKINQRTKRLVMAAFFLWCILFLICWPLALFALILYPLVWLFLLPFRLVGIAVEGALKLVWAVVTLPARLLAVPFRV
jgi:hypothetical protein